MPVWKMTTEDYSKIKASERHHFIHENATTRSPDKSHYHMSFSRNVATMLRAELGVTLTEIVMKDENGLPCPHDHPPEARTFAPAVLRRAALNAPGFNRRRVRDDAVEG